MEEETVNRVPAKKTWLIVVVAAVLVLFLYYMVMAMIAPARKMNRIREEYAFRQDEKKTLNDSVLTDSAYLSLFREYSFLKARTEMAETDSIYMTMNLADSGVTLEISGVTVARTRFTRLSSSKIFHDRYSYVVSSMLSKPFTIVRNFSSIPKEPLMIKMAPKDTSEFKPDIIPDTADFEPVDYIMEMDNGVVIYVYQEEKLNRGDGSHLFFFDLRYRVLNAWRTMKSVFTFKIPEYHPYIKVRLPRTDAKIIYRALPENGQIAIYR
jgi:hypothetical protein